jgi:hypothetical protein
MLNLPILKSCGDANVDAYQAAAIARIAEWVERAGGLDAAEQKAADALANAESRLADQYPYRNPDASFAQPHLGCDHEAGVWRRDRDEWRNVVANLARFRAVNPALLQEAA